MKNETSQSSPARRATGFDIFQYALGDGAFSIIMNGMNNFAMIFLTQILGLGPRLAALTISIALVWDAVTDPVMGHISDNTRSRWGRRQPYILIGGILSAIAFISFWTLPQLFSTQMMIFISVLFLNLLIRTALTIYMVPYTALGFEICPEYESRAQLQGMRFFINQITNFTFGALAWSLFFQERTDAGGGVIDGSLIPSNYLTMSFVLAFFMALLVVVCCRGMRKFTEDNRANTVSGNTIKEFWKDFASIFKDRLAVRVFLFFIAAQFAIMLMGQTQMFTYIFYMKFSAVEKTVVHGAGMLSFAFASLCLSKVVKRFDKKPAGFIGMALSMFGGIGLFVIFFGGILQPQQLPFTVFGKTFSVAMVVFGLLQMCWWGGCGLFVPLASSMVADIAAINEQKTGQNKNASYAAVFTFCIKAAGSIGIILCGAIIAAAGIISGAAEQSPEAVRRIGMMTFLSGPSVMIFAIVLLAVYPVTRKSIEENK